jgi:hypothetical protein
VSDNDFPALFYHAGDVAACFSGSFELMSDSLVFFVFDQGIATDGDDCGFSSSHTSQLEGNDILNSHCPIKAKRCNFSSSDLGSRRISLFGAG